ncbi:MULTISPECIES: DUF6069 family protein [unclassified Spirillospora]|uniref:DUF6069 family protein n=1 Tax=unclassified Spirillospora TaxID=2642701 RepID=UPI00372442B0
MSDLASRRLITAGGAVVAVWAAAKGVGPGLKQPASGSARPGRIWTAVATACLLLSLSGPFTGHGVSTANWLGLVLLHLAVGAVVIPALAMTTRRAS